MDGRRQLPRVEAMLHVSMAGKLNMPFRAYIYDAVELFRALDCDLPARVPEEAAAEAIKHRRWPMEAEKEYLMMGYPVYVVTFEVPRKWMKGFISPEETLSVGIYTPAVQSGEDDESVRLVIE